MSTIKHIPESDIEKFVTISANAYPGWGIFSDEDRQADIERLREVLESPTRELIGLYRNDELLGGMIYHDFDMTFESERLPAAGVGRVAVDLLHKKEKVALEMLKAFIYEYRERGVPLLMLYPFRPDFYHKMGFGYGPKSSSYKFQPSSLPGDGEKGHVRFLDKDDKGRLLEYYNQRTEVTHGMIKRTEPDFKYWFKERSVFILGYCPEGEIDGYLVFQFEEGSNFLDNRLKILEMIYEDSSGMRALLTFMRSQLDQVSWITYSTHDESFHYLLKDPRNDSKNILWPITHESNLQGVGLMYRIVDILGFFKALKEHQFGSGSFQLGLKITDDLIPENDMDLVLDVAEGFVSPSDTGSADVELRMEIQDFSSMAVGAVAFRELYRLGLAHLSDESYLQAIDSMFRTSYKPICFTRF
ncbi:MAG: enhanced intracellular survival protein Eis [Candidatus Promineifilaceae bacterium]